MARHHEPISDSPTPWTHRVRRWLRLGDGAPRLAYTSGPSAPPSTSSRTTPFLGPDQFRPGSYTPKLKGTTTGGRATYRGTIVCTNLKRELVHAILPPDSELELARNSVASDLHPVIHLYGHPEQTSWIVDNQEELHGANYTELMLLVPFVQKGEGRPWHTFVVRMYLNNPVAIRIGNEYFAYGKEYGTPREQDVDLWASEIRVYDEHDVLKFEAQITRRPGWRSSQRVAAAIPNYEAIQTILAMPVVGWQPPSGPLVCSYFELNYRDAMVASVDSTHVFHHPFVPGMSAWHGLGQLSNVVDGAFSVTGVEWRIDRPPAPDCRF